MGTDVCALVRRDHEDLDRTLTALLDERRSRSERIELLDAFRIGLVAHVAAESAVFANLVVRTRPPLLVRLIVKQLDEEHHTQLAAIDSIAMEQTGSSTWCERLLQLRIQFLDHAAREDYFPSSLHDHVPAHERRQLAAEYATERLRAMSALAPMETAREAAIIRFN